MKRAVAFLMISLAALPAASATRLLVTVIDRRSGEPVTDLKAADFKVTANKAAKQIEACEYRSDLVDVMLLLDSSLIGNIVSPLAVDLIKQLGEKEQMAIVAYHAAADLIQDFTASRELLQRAVEQVEYGNAPRLLDALYAAIREGFEGASFRRVVLLLTSGVDGPSSVSEKEVIRLARRHGVSIYPVYVMGYGRSLMERLAGQTGGASFNLREMGERMRGSPAERIFQVVRGHYVLTLAGNLPLGEDLKVEVARPQKLLISVLPLE
jgi:VWFA-related protein